MKSSIKTNNKGVEHFLNKDFERAEEEYKKALQANSKNTTALNNLGLIYHQKGEYEKAAENFKKAIALNEKDTYYLNLANALVFLKKYKEAEESYKKCLRINPQNEIAKMSMARFFEALKQPQRATVLWEDLANSTAHDYYKLELAKNYIAIGWFENALSMLHHLNSKNENAKLLCYIGVCEFNLKNYGLAENALKNSLALEPDDYKTRHYLAINYLSKGDYQKSIKEFDFLIKMNPDDTKVKLDKASLLLNIGKYNEAMELIDYILKIEPENGKALYYKKVVSKMNGK